MADLTEDMTGTSASPETATTLAALVHIRASSTPDRTALRFQSDALTYRELDDRAARLASGLAELGVGPGDPVCVLFDTSCDYVATWLAVMRIGAVEVPINTGFRGAALAHALRLAEAAVLLVDAAYVPLVADLLSGAPSIRQVILRGDRRAGDQLRGVDVVAFTDVMDPVGGHDPVAERAPGDPAMLLFTSGSTGPSKACSIPHRYVLRQPEIFCAQLGIRSGDVLYAPFPLFHADGAIFTVAAALVAGATAALAPRFSVRTFWADCRRHGATVFDYMGATLTMLYNEPPSSSDADNPVRLGWGVPAPPWAAEFERRFDLELVEVYGSSDAGIVLYNRPGEPRRNGSCGRAVAPFNLRIHDPHGLEVPPGQSGELVIRADEPHVMMSGYHADPTATADAFRDLWFHTGDLMRQDDDGYFYFVGRLKDIIRRRGENISAYDVEQELAAHRDLVEVAAYGVPSELTEEDVMVTVVPRDGVEITASNVWEWAVERLARHAVPRYVRITDALPRTETEKVAKQALKELGVTSDTADREAARGADRNRTS